MRLYDIHAFILGKRLSISTTYFLQNQVYENYNFLMLPNKVSVLFLSTHKCFFYTKKSYLIENIFYGYKWMSKIIIIPCFYKRYTSWLEFEICCANYKFFVITAHLLVVTHKCLLIRKLKLISKGQWMILIHTLFQ